MKKNRFLFFWNFIKHPLQNASAIPSSKATTDAILHGIDFSKIKTIVELGAGEGTFTKALVGHTTLDTKIIVIEFNPLYADILRKRFGKRVCVECADANHLTAILKKHDIDKVDLILSGLPFLYGDEQKKLINTFQNLTKNGSLFRFLTYMPPMMKKIYAPLPVKKHRFVLKNFPPAWIYGIN